MYASWIRKISLFFHVKAGRGDWWIVPVKRNLSGLEDLCGAWMARLISVPLHSNWAVHISVNAPRALKECGCYKGRSKPFWNKWHRNKRGQCLNEHHMSEQLGFEHWLGHGQLEGVLDQFHVLFLREQGDRHHVEAGLHIVGIVFVDEVQSDL